MAISPDKLQKVIDLPVWEWARPAPANSTALSALTSADVSTDSRYIYYLVSTAFYRYDTISDSWMTLTSLPITPATRVSMKYAKQGGYRGRILSATSTTFNAAGLQGDIFSGYKIRIYAGKGIGQERTITKVNPTPIIHDQGVATATTSTLQIQDTTKKWKFNQWVGYQINLPYGTASNQRRKIIYNATDTLHVFNFFHQTYEPFNNMAFLTTPVSTAGSQTHYQIESSIFTIDKAWDIIPDNTSRFLIDIGGIWLLTSSSATPFYQLYYYDIASDIWINKTLTQGLLLAAYGTDFSLEKTGAIGVPYVTGSINSATNRIIRFNNNISSSLDRWVNYEIKITSGSGFPQTHRIVANTTSSLEIDSVFNPPLATGSKFEIRDDQSSILFAGGGLSSMFNFNMENDLTTQGSLFDAGIGRTMAIQRSGSEAFGVASGTRTTSGITAVNSVPTVKGTNYVVGDVLTITTGGTNGKVYVETVSSGGLVETVSLFAAGSGYTTGTGKVTSGGTGTGCTVEITSIGTVGRIVTSLNHDLKIGDVITYTGANEAAWNKNYTILGVDSLTGLDVVITATANAVLTINQSSTLIVDCTKNWITNEHVGKIVHGSNLQGSMILNNLGLRRITANTATTLTLQSAMSNNLNNGSSRYVIHEPYAFGRDQEYLNESKNSFGYATSGSTTTLVDTSKNWNTNQWANYKFRIAAGTGRDNEITITSNTSNTLTFAAQIFSPDKTTKYIVMDTFGLCTAGSTTTLQDTTKNWATNRWAGKRVRITSGTGAGNEYSITSNTNNTLTFAAATAPGTDSTYTILGIPTRGTGIDLIHAWNMSDFSQKGKYYILARGGVSNNIDRYDVTKDLWNYGVFLSPMFETLTTGAMYTYDFEDRIYFTKDATGRVFVYNMLTNMIQNAGQIPFGQSTAVLGNRFEFVKTSDGIKYLYMMRHSDAIFWRSLLFYT